MSELSYLEKLLDGVKVEWKTLEKVLDLDPPFPDSFCILS